MRIASINDSPLLSTGAIMNAITRFGWVNGHDMYTFTPVNDALEKHIPGHYYIGNYKSHKRHVFWGQLTGRNGFFEKKGTLQLVNKLNELKVDLIHIHSLDNFCLNLPIFFNYLRDKNIPVIWTMHSCFPFTGKCSRYSAVGCDKWQSGCNHCPILKVNPKSLLFDNSSFMWKNKSRLFNSLENLTMVGCSQWISNEARKSFLKGFPIKTIHNGINTYTKKSVICT